MNEFDAIKAKLLALPVKEDAEAEEATEATRKAQWALDCRKFWQGLAPEAFWANDDGRDAELSAVARDWRAVAGDRPFLAIFGESRVGKSWACYHALKRDIFSRRSVIAMRVSQLSTRLSTLFREDPEEHDTFMADLQRVEVLYLDDLDKAVFTERFSQQLFDIIDSRAANRKATLITANTSASQLREALEKNGQRFAGPLVNRIIENSKLVTTKRKA